MRIQLKNGASASVSNDAPKEVIEALDVVVDAVRKQFRINRVGHVTNCRCVVCRNSPWLKEKRSP